MVAPGSPLNDQGDIGSLCASDYLSTAAPDERHPVTIGWTSWLILGGLNIIVWSARALAMMVELRHRLMLSSTSHAGKSQHLPKLSVLVAAKDEEANIETCIRGLLAQDYPDFELIAINDRSGDATPQILRRLAAESDGLRVLHVEHLPPGWFGKNHAMHQGVRTAQGEWLLCTDADCRFTSTRALSAAMFEALESKSDFLCLTPVLETPSAWERIIQPVCSMVLILWFLPHRVNNAKHPTAYANGAFMLLRRSCYEAIGGHEAVREAPNEDIQLAKRAKSRGFRLRVMENSDLYSTRMYHTFAELRRGWRRIFRGCLETVPRLGTSLALILTFTILPWLSTAAAIAGRVRCGEAEVARWNMAVLLWGTSFAMLQTLTWRYYRMLQIPARWSLGYFLGALVVVGILIHALADTLMSRSIRWRGTDYRKPADGQVTTP